MKIALIGYGKMGKEIESIALSKGHEIVLKIDKDTHAGFNKENLQKADVAIEFSTPHSVLDNIYTCFEANIPVVVGTTGWYEKFEEVKLKCKEKNQSLFYATNYSIGVNLFFHLNKKLAAMMKKYSYEISMDEIHHTQKLDAPSGTAITLAEGIIQENPSKSNWINKIVTEKDSAIDTNLQSNELIIRSYREDQVPGTHTVYYNSAVDRISISHVAHNRKGFAAGALSAAEWLIGKKGIYTMNDMLSFE